MENGTCASERWLRRLADSLRPLPRNEALSMAAGELFDHFGTRVWFAEVYGTRWSFIGGAISEEPSAESLSRIQLTPRFGLVAEGWEHIPTDLRKGIIAVLRDALAAPDGESPA